MKSKKIKMFAGAMIAFIIIIGVCLILTPKSTVIDQDITDRMLEEVYTHIRTSEESYSQSDEILALIKTKGLLGNLEKNLLEEDRQKLSMIDKEISDKIGSFSTIFFGYSESGVLFVALIAPRNSNHYNYIEAMNKIRGIDDAGEFLVYAEIAGEGELSVIDVYVEDLYSNNTSYDLDVSMKFGELSKGLNENYDSEEFRKVFSDFDREYKINAIIDDKTWGIFVLDNLKSMVEEIEINFSGEIVTLRSK